eukprot:6180848-Pleurochrysis_carterae.AAC.3
MAGEQKSEKERERSSEGQLLGAGADRGREEVGQRRREDRELVRRRVRRAARHRGSTSQVMWRWKA